MDPAMLLCSVLLICSPQPAGDLNQMAVNSAIANLQAAARSLQDAVDIGDQSLNQMSAAINQSIVVAQKANAQDFVAALQAMFAIFTQNYKIYTVPGSVLLDQLLATIAALDQTIPTDLAAYTQAGDTLYSDILAKIAEGPGTGRQCAELALVGLRSVQMNFLFSLAQQLNQLAASMQGLSQTSILFLYTSRSVVVEQVLMFRPDLATLADATTNYDLTMTTSVMPLIVQIAGDFATVAGNVLSTLVSAVAGSAAAQTAIEVVNTAYVACIG